MILAIDPGTTESGFVRWETYCVPPPGLIHSAGKEANADLLDRISCLTQLAVRPTVVIERFASYGMAIGQTTIDAIAWGGRFWERAEALGIPVRHVFRRDIKLHFCGTARANDSTIRQAILDRFGGREKAVGTKAAPGPLRSVKADAWSALALALYHLDNPLPAEDFVV